MKRIAFYLSCNKNHRFHTLCIRNYMLYNLDFIVQCRLLSKQIHNLFNDADITTIFLFVINLKKINWEDVDIKHAMERVVNIL